MNSIKDLLNKNRQVIKFLIAGGTATSVDLALLYFFTDILGIWYLISACLAFTISFFVSFFLQKFWTFSDNDKQKIYQQMGTYLAVALSNLAINVILMYALVDGLKIWYMLAQFFVSGVIAIESYLIYNYFIFNMKTKANAPEIKVLIATGIYPPDIGGPAAMIEALTDGLKQDGFKVKVLTYSDEAGNGEVVKISRCQNSLMKYLKYFWAMLKLSYWADVVYVTDTYSVGYFAYLIKKLTGRKYIVRFAGDSAWEKAVNQGLTKDYIGVFQNKNYCREIEKLKKRRFKIVAGADKIIAVSNFIAGIVKNIGAKEAKIKMIYNSVDFLKDKKSYQALVNEIKERYGKNSKLIITACRLTPWKGVDGLIRAMPGLKSSLGRVNLLVLGDGSELNSLKQLAKELDVSEAVFFPGKIDNSQVMDYFRAADLFVLNTNYEGLSHTILEAMEAGLPVVASNIDGNQEVIDDGINGLLVNYNNEAELSAAIKKILTDRELAEKFKINAREKLKIFDWSKTIAQTEAVIREVAGQ